jgi:hypothetical protein
MLQSKISNFSRSVLALSCFGLLLTGALSGCGGGSSQQEEKKIELLKMDVSQLDQFSKLDDKTADGQFMVVKVNLKNLSNQTVVLTPSDFNLENITTEEKDRYSQPSEKNIGGPFSRVYGDSEKDKIMALNNANLYPRMELVRYFVFMLPSSAKPEAYQITYTSTTPPTKVSVPLATPGSTTINDHRNESEKHAEP